MSTIRHATLLLFECVYELSMCFWRWPEDVLAVKTSDGRSEHKGSGRCESCWINSDGIRRRIRTAVFVWAKICSSVRFILCPDACLAAVTEW